MALTAKKVYAILKRQISDMEAKLNSPVRYRGTVATADLLPLNPDIGDMYNIESKSVYGEAGMNVAWNGVVWDTMGAPIDMSLYIKSDELADWVKQQNKPTYTAEEVGALPADTKIPSKTSDLQNDSGFLTKIPDNYLSGTDKTLSVSGKAADAKTVGDKNVELLANILSKLDKNQGSENSGKIAGINESGDIVPMFPVGVEYNSETNCLEFGSDQKMELNQGIGLDSTLTKTGFAADAGAVGEITNSLKEDLSKKITKFYASSQGNTNLQDSDNGKIMDMMLYGKSEQKQYSGKNLLNATLQTITQNDVTCTNNGDGTYALNGSNANIPSVFTLGTVYLIKDKKYKMAGCPANPGKAYLQLRTPEPDNVAYKNDYSSGVEFVIPKSGEYIVRIYYDVETYNNLLFKPMITTDLTATYDDFEPYTGGIPSPNPDYPQEIKSVVNPTVKVCGKNLLNATLQTTTQNGVTCTNNGDGTYTLNGTATATGIFILHSNIDFTGQMRLCGGTSLVYLQYSNSSNFAYEDKGAGIIIEHFDSVTYPNASFNILIKTDNVYNNVLVKPMLTTDLTATYNDFEPYHEQTATLPYTLNAIPVSAGGNVTIDGQQYIADYVDVERGKLVRMVDDVEAKNYTWILYPDVNNMPRRFAIDDVIRFDMRTNTRIMSFHFKQIEYNARTDLSVWFQRLHVVITDMNEKWKNSEALIQWFSENNVHFYLPLKTPTEIDLTPEEVRTFKALVTYYPTTNISINSEQLDGYTVFNYPISMENGWNYVKQQIGDTRDYIYDMDARTQDTDLQAAEAYVNSEYAVALTELEV
nr:MAG TPA: hypothetical protein [Caudoviricetes sp.]